MDQRASGARNGTAGGVPADRYSLRDGILRDAWLIAIACLVRPRQPVHTTTQFYNFVLVGAMAGDSLTRWKGSYLKVHQNSLPSFLDQTLGICRSQGIVLAGRGEQGTTWARGVRQDRAALVNQGWLLLSKLAISWQYWEFVIIINNRFEPVWILVEEARASLHTPRNSSEDSFDLE